MNKPFLILNYQKWDKKGKIREEKQKIFIRKNTGTFEATKNDIEIMYYDRKNIIPEYDVQVSVVFLNAVGKKGNWLHYGITIENIGRRPLCLKSISFLLNQGEHLYRFDSEHETTLGDAKRISFPSIIIKSQSMQYFEGQAVVWLSSDLSAHGLIVQIEKGEDFMLELRLTNGNVITAKAEIVNREQIAERGTLN